MSWLPPAIAPPFSILAVGPHFEKFLSILASPGTPNSQKMFPSLHQPRLCVLFPPPPQEDSLATGLYSYSPCRDLVFSLTPGFFSPPHNSPVPILMRRRCRWGFGCDSKSPLFRVWRHPLYAPTFCLLRFNVFKVIGFTAPCSLFPPINFSIFPMGTFPWICQTPGAMLTPFDQCCRLNSLSLRRHYFHRHSSPLPQNRRCHLAILLWSPRRAFGTSLSRNPW